MSDIVFANVSSVTYNSTALNIPGSAETSNNFSVMVSFTPNQALSQGIFANVAMAPFTTVFNGLTGAVPFLPSQSYQIELTSVVANAASN